MHQAGRLVLVVVLLILGCIAAVPAATFTVDSTGDEPDQTPGDGVARTAAGAATLRAAIMEANAKSGPHTIQFKIGSGGAKTINVATELPPINQPATIDGTTQPGYAGKPLIELHGNTTYASIGYGLSLNYDGCVVRGLVINNFWAGINVYRSYQRIENCYIGTDLSGATAVHNRTGIDCYCSEGHITIGPGNVISGNSICGIRFDSYLVRNYPDQGVIKGNIIGLDATGSKPLPIDQHNGVITYQVTGIEAGEAVIGGTRPEDRNIISGNLNGIDFGHNIAIKGNYIGTDITGLKPIGNSCGIDAEMGSIIGGPEPGAGNVIAACDLGISVGLAETIQNNRIGVGADGITSMGCTIGIQGWHVIGGIGANEGNTIAYCKQAAIVVARMGYPSDGQPITNIRGNSIFANNWQTTRTLAGKPTALDLNDDGITPNDAGDGDTGPNGLQNYPVLTGANPHPGGKHIRIQGTLNSQPNQFYDLDFYANTHASSLTQPEGERYLGSLTVTTNSQGNANFSVTLACDCKGLLTASITATDAAGRTSEFAPCIRLGPPRNSVETRWDLLE